MNRYAARTAAPISAHTTNPASAPLARPTMGRSASSSPRRVSSSRSSTLPSAIRLPVTAARCRGRALVNPGQLVEQRRVRSGPMWNIQAVAVPPSESSQGGICPAPVGLTYWHVVDLLHGLAQRPSILGTSVDVTRQKGCRVASTMRGEATSWTGPRGPCRSDPTCRPCHYPSRTMREPCAGLQLARRLSVPPDHDRNGGRSPALPRPW